MPLPSRPVVFLATSALALALLPPTAVEAAPPPASAFSNTHYVALLNLNSECGSLLGYGDHLIFSRLAAHATSVLGVPAGNVHVFNEAGVALDEDVDPDHFPLLPPEWKTGAAFDGPARWSVFAPALRALAASAADAEAAGGAPARVFLLQSSHGLQGSVVLGDGLTDSIFCLQDVDVSSTMMGDLLDDIDADAAAEHPGLAIEWSLNFDCSFCGGFADSPLPAPATTPVASAGVVGPNRVVEVGCAWVTECFGNPAVTYDYMFNACAFTGQADGFRPLVQAGAGTGTDGGDAGSEVLVANPIRGPQDGMVTLEEAYWCGLARSRAPPLDPIAIQQMFQISDNLRVDVGGLDGFPLWKTGG